MAKKENKSEIKVLEDVIEKGIKIIKKEEFKIPEYLIGNKDTYNPGPERLMKFAGIGSTDKLFNAVELVREMRERRL